MTATASGIKNRILEEAPSLGFEVNPNQAMKIALRLTRRNEYRKSELDFYEALRVLGIINDPTARLAAHKVSCIARECNDCGRTSARTAA